MRGFLAALCCLCVLLFACAAADAALFSRPAAGCDACQVATDPPTCDRSATEAANRPHLCPWNCPCRPKEVSVNLTELLSNPLPGPVTAVSPALKPRFPYGLLGMVVGLALLVSAPVAFALRMRAATPNM
jgi:hypothetical protein